MQSVQEEDVQMSLKCWEEKLVEYTEELVKTMVFRTGNSLEIMKEVMADSRSY
jgi:hypothetical protein